MLLNAVATISDGSWLDVIAGETVVVRCSMTGTNGTARVVIEESHDQVGVANSITFDLSTSGGEKTAAFRTAAVHLRARVIRIGGTSPAVTVSESLLSSPAATAAAANAGYAADASQAYVSQLAALANQTQIFLRAPTMFDDSSRGFAIGNYWYALGRLWKAVRVTANSAVWQEFGLTNGRIIDAVGVAALGAYGTVRLRAGYTTNSCFEITRASDSTTLTIGFVNDVADWAAVDAFITGTTGGISKWYDQSGNTRDVVQATAGARPLVYATEINGIRCITMQISGRWLNLPAGVALTSRANCCVAAIVMPGTGSGLVYALATDASTSGMMAYGNSSTPGQAVVFNGSTAFAASQPDCGSMGLNIMNSAAGGVTTHSNEESVTVAAFAAGATVGGAIGATTFGSIGQFADTGNWQGFIVWNQALTTNQIVALKESAYRSFRIAPQNKSVNIALLGDSITSGFGDPTGFGFARQLATSLKRPGKVQNYGIPGATAAAYHGFAPTYAPQGIVSGANAKNIAVVWLGTNDTYTGSSAAVAYAAIQSVCADARAAGRKVVAVTALARTPSGGSDAQRLACNALIVANWASFADALADVAADTTMQTFGDTTLYGDGTHPTALGYSYVAPIVAAAVNTLL